MNQLLPQKRPLKKRPFTLMEMVIAVAIIALLAAFAVPAYMKHLKRARRAQGKAQIQMLSQAVSDFNLDTKKWPRSLEELITNPGEQKWDGPYLTNTKSVPKDPWGHDYVFSCPGQNEEFEIVCYGADGAAGGAGENADILSYDMSE